jgi:hypothetical protein
MIHTNETDIKVISIDNISQGMVRRIGPDCYLWSHLSREGRSRTEADAFLQLGFILEVDGQLSFAASVKPREEGISNKARGRRIHIK